MREKNHISRELVEEVAELLQNISDREKLIITASLQGYQIVVTPQKNITSSLFGSLSFPKLEPGE